MARVSVDNGHGTRTAHGTEIINYNRPTAWFYVAYLDHFRAIIVSIIVLVLPSSSNIVDFILPG